MQLHLNYLRSVAYGLKRIRRKILGTMPENGIEGTTMESWKCIGSGHFSNVWASDLFPGVVVKLCCRGDYNDGYIYRKRDAQAAKDRMYDVWPQWAQLCMKYEGKVQGLPKIHMLEKGEGQTWIAVMKQYEADTKSDYWGMAEEAEKSPPIHYAIRSLQRMSDWKHEPVDMVIARLDQIIARRKNSPLARFNVQDWRMIRDLVVLIKATGAKIDYHSANRMQDEDGNLIVTDPLCASCDQYESAQEYAQQS